MRDRRRNCMTEKYFDFIDENGEVVFHCVRCAVCVGIELGSKVSNKNAGVVLFDEDNNVIHLTAKEYNAVMTGFSNSDAVKEDKTETEVIQ